MIDFEIPLDRNRLWYNRLDAEQHYGLVAMEPEPRLPEGPLAARLTAWRAVPTLYRDDDGTRIRALADEAYLWLLVEGGDDRTCEWFVGFDVFEPEAGGLRWPLGVGPEIPVGVEFVLRHSPASTRMLAHPSVQPYRVVELPEARSSGLRTVAIADPPAGLFSGRYTMRDNAPYRSEPRRDGRYDTLRVVVNARRFGRDTVEHAGFGYDRGVLPGGAPPDGFWERDAESGAVEIRIPWGLLNFTDPSQRRVLWDRSGTGTPMFPTETVDAIGITVAARRNDGRWRAWPASGRADDVARFSWATWEAPRWRARPRPVYAALREVFAELSRKDRWVGVEVQR